MGSERLRLFDRSLTAVEDDDHFRAYLIATCAGVYSLFPLLIKPAGELPPISLCNRALAEDHVFRNATQAHLRPRMVLLRLLFPAQGRLSVRLSSLSTARD